MKSKNGYKKDKTEPSTGRWLKWYFAKRTCKKSLFFEDEISEEKFVDKHKIETEEL